MTRAFAILLATVTLLAGAGHAQAQIFNDNLDLTRGGPNFFGGGASPIPRTTVNFDTNYTPAPSS